MVWNVTTHRPADPGRSPLPTGAADEGGDHATITAQQSLETVGVRFEGSEAGDTLGLQVRDPVSGQWVTLVGSNKDTERFATDLGTFAEGTDLEFQLINHSQGTSYSSKSGMAKVQQNGDGTVTIAFEDREGGDRDFNDFVFTVYKKDPQHDVVRSNLTGETIQTGNNRDFVLLSGQMLRNQVLLGWDNDDLLFGGVESEDNDYRGEDGDDSVRGQGDFKRDRFDGGAGNDEFRLSGRFEDVRFEGGASERRSFERMGVSLENDGGNDLFELTGALRRTTIAAGGGRDTVSVDGLSEGLTIDAGDGDDQVALQGMTRGASVALGGGGDALVVAGVVQDTTLDLGEGDDQLYVQAHTQNVTVDMGRGGDTVVLGVEWTGEITVSDPKRAQAQKDGDVKDYDRLVFEGPGWRKVDDRTYQKVQGGEVVGTVRLAGDRKDIEIVADTLENTFQKVDPKKPKRSFFSKVVDFALGAVTFFAPPVGAALSAIKTGIDIATGKIKGLGNILLSVGSAAFGNLKGAVASVAGKVLDGFSRVKGFIENPSLLGGLSLASFTAGVTGNPVTQNILSGVKAIWQGVKTGDLSQVWNVLSSARTIERVDAQRTLQARLETLQASAEGVGAPVELTRALAEHYIDGEELQFVDDLSQARPGDLVRDPHTGEPGLVGADYRIFTFDLETGRVTGWTTSLLAYGPSIGADDSIDTGIVTDSTPGLDGKSSVDDPTLVAASEGIRRLADRVERKLFGNSASSNPELNATFAARELERTLRGLTPPQQADLLVLLAERSASLPGEMNGYFIELLRGAESGHLAPGLFNTLYGQGRIRRGQLQSIFDGDNLLRRGVTGADVRDVVARTAGAPGSALRNDLAAQLLDADYFDVLGEVRWLETAALLSTDDPTSARRAGSVLYAHGDVLWRLHQNRMEGEGQVLLEALESIEAEPGMAPIVRKVRNVVTLRDGAEVVEQEVAQRRSWLADYGLGPEETAYHSHLASLERVSEPQNRAFIEQMAQRYGLPPSLLAGVVAAELRFDYDVTDAAQTFLGGLGLGGGAAGITSVQPRTLRAAQDYLDANALPGAGPARQIEISLANMSTFEGAVEAAAIVTSMYHHAHGGASNPLDMAVIWGGFRTGVAGVSPTGAGYASVDDFRRNVANGAEDLPSGMSIGGNAFQSIPYFKYLLENY